MSHAAARVARDQQIRRESARGGPRQNLGLNLDRHSTLLDSIPARPYAQRQAQQKQSSQFASTPLQIFSDDDGNQGSLGRPPQGATQSTQNRQKQIRTVQQSQDNFDGLLADYNSLTDDQVKKESGVAFQARTRDRNRANGNRQPQNAELNSEDLAYEASRRVNERYADARSRIDATLEDTNVSRVVDELNISDRNELLVEHAGFQNTPVRVIPSEKVDDYVNGINNLKRGGTQKKTLSRLLNQPSLLSVDQTREQKEQEYEKIQRLLATQGVQRALEDRVRVDKPFRLMNEFERRQRIRQLWSKVRLFVFMRRRLNSVKYDMEKRELAEMLDQRIPSDIESDNSDGYNSDDERIQETQLDLPWYKFNVHGQMIRVWDSIFALVILFNIVWSPVAIAFQHNFYQEDDTINWDALDLTINAFWLIAFFINLNRVDEQLHRFTFWDTSKAYLRSPYLIPDFVTMVGSITMILLNKPIQGKYFELVRLLHYKKTLYPVNLLIQITVSSGQKRISQIQSLVFIFFFFVMLAHLCACLWIYSGFIDRNEVEAARESWVYVNDLHGNDEEGNPYLKDSAALYVFSLYWVFTTLTTVGYGDYSAGTTAEYLIVVVFEFIGFCYNAVLISIMSSFFASEATFQDLLDSRLDQMDLWMKRIERSYKPYYMPPELAKRIQETVQEAFRSDYNLIVEEYQLYQQLTPKMQTELIQKIFNKFIQRFKYFFNSCEIGFRNEFIIWMYARKYLPGTVIQSIGKEAEEIVFVIDGQVDLYTKNDQKFMQLPQDAIFNDYQLIFNLKSNIQYRSFSPTYVNEAQFREGNETLTMNLEGEKFKDLLELYEDTAMNLKLRALEKRSILMYYKNKVIRRAVQRKKNIDRKAEEKLGKMAGYSEDEIEQQSQDQQRTPELYESTYMEGKGKGKNGTDMDSDRDPYHITMPFRKSDELRKKIFDSPEFETDEEHEIEFEEQDKENARLVDCQNQILETMQKTLMKMSDEIRENRKPKRSMAHELKTEVQKVHKDFKGLSEGYQIVEENEEADETQSQTAPSQENDHIERLGKRKSVLEVAKKSSYSANNKNRSGAKVSVGRATGFSNANTELDVSEIRPNLAPQRKPQPPQRSQSSIGNNQRYN